MKFHEFRTWWQSQGAPFKKLGRQQFYQLESTSVSKSDPVFGHILANESEWYESRQPYYKVYPCIVDALCKLKLNFNCECPKVPEGTICIRFAEGHEPESKDGNKITSLLVHADRDVQKKERLLIQVTLKNDPDKFYWFYFDTNDPSMTIQEGIDSATWIHKDVMVLATRIALTVLMLADDPEIITPDVLAADQNRYDNETDDGWKMKAKEKAKQRGVFGWSIGKDIHVAPHVRRPHWAVRWTGPGKKIPQIRPIKGCKVNWDKLTKVPTGHMLPDGTEVEDRKIAS